MRRLVQVNADSKNKTVPGVAYITELAVIL